MVILRSGDGDDVALPYSGADQRPHWECCDQASASQQGAAVKLSLGFDL